MSACAQDLYIVDRYTVYTVNLIHISPPHTSYTIGAEIMIMGTIQDMQTWTRTIPCLSKVTNRMRCACSVNCLLVCVRASVSVRSVDRLYWGHGSAFLSAFDANAGRTGFLSSVSNNIREQRWCVQLDLATHVLHTRACPRTQTTQPLMRV